jgi:hypothetical protein
MEQIDDFLPAESTLQFHDLTNDSLLTGCFLFLDTGIRSQFPEQIIGTDRGRTWAGFTLRFGRERGGDDFDGLGTHDCAPGC